jgi:hypothetical protein
MARQLGKRVGVVDTSCIQLRDKKPVVTLVNLRRLLHDRLTVIPTLESVPTKGICKVLTSLLILSYTVGIGLRLDVLLILRILIQIQYSKGATTKCGRKRQPVAVVQNGVSTQIEKFESRRSIANQ